MTICVRRNLILELSNVTKKIRIYAYLQAGYVEKMANMWETLAKETSAYVKDDN